MPTIPKYLRGLPPDLRRRALRILKKARRKLKEEEKDHSRRAVTRSKPPRLKRWQLPDPNRLAPPWLRALLKEPPKSPNRASKVGAVSGRPKRVRRGSQRQKRG